MDKQGILNKYTKPEDKLIISKMIDKQELSSVKNKIENTNFLDIYQSNLLEKILKQEKVENYIISGGKENTERKIIVFYPEKLKSLVEMDYRKILPITCIRIELPKEKYGNYSHRDYLGGLIKLGIKREKIGDIFVFNNGADIIILEEILKFLKTNLSSLTRFSKATIEQINLSDVREKNINREKMNIIVASMRLDCVISEILKTSRTIAEKVINESRVFINFEPINKITKQVKEKDLITIRGKGRFEIQEIEGITKNNRVKLVINKFV